jgi:hypothetical protein
VVSVLLKNAASEMKILIRAKTNKSDVDLDGKNLLMTEALLFVVLALTTTQCAANKKLVELMVQFVEIT